MHRFLQLLLVVALTGGGVAAQARLGFVNMQKVILDYEKTRAITAQLEKELSAKRSELQQDSAKIQTMKENLDLLEDGSLEQLQKLKDIRLMEVELDLKKKTIEILFEQRLVEHMKKVYADVRKEVGLIAGERGLSAVYMVRDGDLEGATRDEVTGNILVRPVLWWDGKLDLTTEVIQRLNVNR